MSNRRRYTMLALLCLSVAACNDDPVRPREFAVTVRVVDETGAPVPGLLMSVASDNPYLQDAGGAKAATVIPFQTPAAAVAELSIEDIEGRRVRELGNQPIPAGVHHWIWDGRDEDGVHLHSGRYTARLVLRDLVTDEIVFTETTDMLMCLLDPVRSPVGQTDRAGRIVLTDRRLFPHLYDRPPMEAVDSDGEITGILAPTAAMIFTLADTVNERGMLFVQEVAGSATLEFVWNGKPRDLTVRGAVLSGGPVLPPVDFELGPAFPNPFN